MSRQRFSLALTDGVYGPGDVDAFTVQEVRLVPGPALPNWQSESLLTLCEKPFTWHNEAVTFVTLNPRYATESITSVKALGGVVAVGRVLPGHDPLKWAAIDPNAIEYWGVGVATLVEDQTMSEGEHDA
jgi:hypothetical protein